MGLGGTVWNCGSTGAGKTTLTAYLVSRGFRYITEDCILINYADELVNPCPLPLHLRDGGAKVLSENNIVLNYQYVDSRHRRMCI